MDKAGITVAAAHKKMLSTSSSMGLLSMMGVGGGGENNKSQDKGGEVDGDAIFAEKCLTIQSRGFDPLENVMSLKEW